MTHSCSTAETDLRDQFLRRAVSSRKVYAISSDKGLARIASRHIRGREVTLMWSEPVPAGRWASLLGEEARVMELALAEVLSNLVPILSGDKRLVGVDWNEAAIEPELDPNDFAEKLRLEMLDSFIDRSVMFGGIWILNDTFGPALLPSATRPEIMVLPCWSDERAAEAHIAGQWPEAATSRIRLDEFLSGTIEWIERMGFLVTPEFTGGPGVLELEAADFRFRLASRRALDV